MFSIWAQILEETPRRWLGEARPALAGEMPHPIHQLPTAGAADLTSPSTGWGKDVRGDQQNY